MNQDLERILLHHEEGSRAGQVDSYTQPTVMIGRAPECHLVLSADKGVSGKHCEIRQSDGQFELVDTNSTNGTFVNDERISTQVLKSGDSIRFGWMGPLAKVEFEERVRAVHPAHPMGDAQSTVMVSARRIAAAADALAHAEAVAAPVKSPQITMPPPSRAPAPPALPAAKPTAAAPPPRPSVPTRGVRPATAPVGAAALPWSAARWTVALTLVVIASAAAAVGVWMLLR